MGFQFLSSAITIETMTTLELFLTMTSQVSWQIVLPCEWCVTYLANVQPNYRCVNMATGSVLAAMLDSKMAATGSVLAAILESKMAAGISDSWAEFMQSDYWWCLFIPNLLSTLKLYVTISPDQSPERPVFYFYFTLFVFNMTYMNFCFILFSIFLLLIFIGWIFEIDFLHNQTEFYSNPNCHSQGNLG